MSYFFKDAQLGSLWRFDDSSNEDFCWLLYDDEHKDHPMEDRGTINFSKKATVIFLGKTIHGPDLDIYYHKIMAVDNDLAYGIGWIETFDAKELVPYEVEQ